MAPNNHNNNDNIFEKSSNNKRNKKLSNCDDTTSSSSSINCAYSDCNVRNRNINLVLIYEGEEFQRKYLEYHVSNYQILNPNISIALQEIGASNNNNNNNNNNNEGEYLIEQIDNIQSQSSWDGIIFPAHLTGALIDSNRLWDWTNYLRQNQEWQQQMQINNNNNNNNDNNNNEIHVKEEENNSIQWEDIQPFFRSQAQQQVISSSSSSSSTITSGGDDDEKSIKNKKTTVWALPLNGDVLSVYYRKDLFEKYQRDVPRTWDAYRDAAAFFHGQPWGPNNTELTGSCVTRANNNGKCGNNNNNSKNNNNNNNNNNINAYWASLVLSTMTQSTGTSSGYLLDPITMDPLLGEAMEETLRILAEQHILGPSEETFEDIECDDNEDDINLRLNEGTCAITYNWGNQLTTETIVNNNNNTTIGVAPTPGSTRVFNRTSGNLESCTPELCPYGLYFDDIGIVNRPSYAAFGGWAGGVSNNSPTREQNAMADFFSYISNTAQSLSDILPNQRSNFVTPYRYSHLQASNWTDVGYDESTISEYKDTIQEVNSGNTVMEIRTPPGTNIRHIIHEEVYSYLLLNSNANTNTKNEGITLNSLDDAILRRKTTDQIDTKIREALSYLDESTVADSYRKSLGFTESPDSVVKSMNYIDRDYRETGWGLAGLICCTAVGLIIWTLWNRKNHVIQACQPFLMIQCAMGLFFMGGTLVPLGFDDSLFSKDVLDITCMVMPWMYMFGYTLFFSSVYSKIQACMRIFKHPGKYDVMSVRPWDSFKTFSWIFLLNGIVLFLWTLLDPLKWVRMEVATDRISGTTLYSEGGTGETYGHCMGERFDYLIFTLPLFVFNMVCIFVAMIQSFRCRFLDLEYHEMQWIQLSILPIFEAWIIGGPVLALVVENPTTKYVLYVFIITTSSIAIAFAVFASKEWFVRKSIAMKFKSKAIAPPLASPAGVKILKHPTVESQKHVVNLQDQLDHYTASNTELGIDIRILQDKFRLLTEEEKLVVFESMFAKEISNSQNSRIHSISQEREEEFVPTPACKSKSKWKSLANSAAMLANDRKERVDSIMPLKNLDNLAVIDSFPATTWSMPAVDDDEKDNTTGDVLEVAGIITAGAALARGTSNSSLISKSIEEENRLRVDKYENDLPVREKKPEKDKANYFSSHPLDPSHRSDLVSKEEDASLSSLDTSLAPSQSHSPLPSRSGDEMVNEIDEIAQEFDNQSQIRAVGSSYSSTEEETPEIWDEIYELNKIIESNDLRELEMETSMIAAQYKLNSTFLESMSDIQTKNEKRDSANRYNEYDGVPYLDISDVSPATENGSKDFVLTSDAMIGSLPIPYDNVALTGISASAGEPSSGETVVSKMSPVSSSEEYSMQQHAGEPSSGDRPPPCKVQKADINVDDDNAGDVENPPILERHKHSTIPPTECSISPTSSTMDSPVNQSQNKRTYTIADWTAVGTMGGLLADLSDSTSTSSGYYESSSMADSISSLEVATSESPSRLNVPLANEINDLLAHSDFDAVKAAAEKYEKTSIIKEDGTHNAKISASRHKKRELEALRPTFRHSDL